MEETQPGQLTLTDPGDVPGLVVSCSAEGEEGRGGLWE